MSDSEHIHEHPHVHHHEHGVIQSDSPEETRILIAYMLSHNEQHTCLLYTSGDQRSDRNAACVAWRFWHSGGSTGESVYTRHQQI